MRINNQLLIRHLGLQNYEKMYRAMVRFTTERNESTIDEIICLEHSPVYTLGLAGKTEHILKADATPVIKTDRGGQVTYHGPGQLIIYLLLDLKRRGLNIKNLVYQLEESVIAMLAECSINANRKAGAPGVYIGERKIAALGIRVRRGCCYHGLALNVDMDTTPFNRINPCGYPGLVVTQLREQGVKLSIEQAAERLLPHIVKNLNYDRENIVIDTELSEFPIDYIAA